MPIKDGLIPNTRYVAMVAYLGTPKQNTRKCNVTRQRSIALNYGEPIQQNMFDVNLRGGALPDFI